MNYFDYNVERTKKKEVPKSVKIPEPVQYPHIPYSLDGIEVTEYRITDTEDEREWLKQLQKK